MRLGTYELRVLGGVAERGGECDFVDTGHDSIGIFLPWRRTGDRKERGYFDYAYHRRIVDRLVAKGLLMWVEGAPEYRRRVRLVEAQP